MVLFVDRKLGLFGSSGGLSLKRLSRYAGLLPAMEGCGKAIVILKIISQLKRLR